MSLYEGRECPSCDGPTEQRGELCSKCNLVTLSPEQLARLRDQADDYNPQAKPGTIKPPFSKAEQVRQALWSIASAMHGDRPQRHAFRNLAHTADDKSLEQLARLLKA